MNEKVLNRLIADNISKRYLAQKLDGLIKDNVGAMAYKAEAIDALKNAKNLLILGETGMGKSYLAFELVFELKIASNGDARFYYNRASILQSDFKANYSNVSKTLESVLSKPSFYYGDEPSPVEVVIIDEVDDLHDYTILNEIIISAYDKLIPVILIGNISYNTLAERLNDKAFSRLSESMAIYSLDGNDLRTQQEVKE